MSSIAQFLESHAEAIVHDIGEFVQRETPSTDKPLLDAFAQYLAAYAGEVSGGRAEVAASSVSGDNVVLHCDGEKGGKPVVMVGHFDTVWPAGTLETMPFSIEGHIARGPGIFDMKAGLVQALWAIRALKETGTPHPPIVFVFNSDEEIGSAGSRALIERHARDARAALVFEPSFEGALKTQRKGVGRYQIDITGRASHAGLNPKAGISAIDEMARVVLTLHGCTDMDTGTTVNVGVVQGGTRYNVVAAHAQADIDVRVVTKEEGARMDGFVRALKPRNPEASFEIAGSMLWPPMERNEAIKGLFAKASTVAKKHLDLVLQEAAVGGASDGCTCAALGLPVLDGMGAVGAGAHAANEHIDLRFVSQRSALAAHLLSEL